MRTLLFLGALVALFATATPSTAGYGSCYEVPPICLSGHPQCLCNQQNYCFWACR